MANPNMANHTYSTAPQVVSRFLAQKSWTRSRTVRGRLTNGWTQGFAVRRVLGETTVTWCEDSRSYGSTGYFEPTRSLDERLRLLTKALSPRYEIARRGDVLIVSERVLKPEVLIFNKRWGAKGPNYVAETETHRYVILRSPANKTGWELKVFSLVNYGESIDPIMVPKEVVHTAKGATKESVTDAAYAFLKKQG